jgi:uncharacterized membrane protein
MTDHAGDERLDRALAALLWYGTWVASALIALGMLVEGLHGATGSAASGHGIVKTGVALLIALPVARVLMLFVVFLRRRDLAYTLISALVLAIISAGVLIGMHSGAAPG